MKHIKAILFLSLPLILLAGVYFTHRPVDVELSYNEFLNQVEQGGVTGVTLSTGDKLRFTLTEDDAIYTTANPRKADLKEMLLLQGIPVTEGGDTSGYVQSAISLLFFATAFYVVYRNMNKQNARGVMALNAQDSKEDERFTLDFSGIAGNDEAKDSVSDIVSFIKNPQKYADYGARMPRGLIFYGPPGTGKTMMAKAVAGEAGVPFYAVSGSDFVQMYVGVGASRIRELFKKARLDKRAVIFIDEIDALGKKRTPSASGGNDERDQTLNALLTEMSGFSSTDGIVVIAATNRLDTLDEALLRPGRFDRQIEIGLPDLKAREAILQRHAADKPISPDVDMRRLSGNTVYFSGAMLENLLNEAAIFAANREAANIEQCDIDKAYYTVIAGSEKKDRSGIRERDRKITAFHESGHALAARLLAPENTVSKITIIPSTKGAGGFCVNIPPDKMYYTKRELKAQVMVNLAGRAAEEIIFGADAVTTGAGNDIEKSTSIIKDLISRYGMGERTGLLNTGMFDASPEMIAECRELADELYSQVKLRLEENLPTLREIADALLQQETLHEEDLDRICNSISPSSLCG